MSKNFYYGSRKNVEDYIQMAKPYNGKELIRQLKKYLEPGSKILELGTGPGKDMDILLKNYRVTGSDLSPVFLELYRERQPDSNLILLDARTLEITDNFDCIFSNKVLHHLSKEELHLSLKKQAKLLNPAGLVMHSFWEGDREEILSGLRFIYYRLEDLRIIFSRYFDIIGIEAYEEELPGDSVWVLGRRKEGSGRQEAVGSL